MMQKHLEKCEEIMSAKSDAKDALAKEVYRYCTLLWCCSDDPTCHIPQS